MTSNDACEASEP